MKSFREYLTETKKVYSFKVKVAGDVPEGFQEHLRKSLEKHQIVTLEKLSTPVQESPMDFPELSNKEVTIFDLVVEYPITAPEIAAFVKELNINEECFRIRNSGSPTEYDQHIEEDQAGALLDDPFYKEEAVIKPKNYFGDDFNKGFLKDLAKASKERRKELEHDKKDPNVLEAAPKLKADKAGLSSPLSKINNASPIKG